MVRGHTEAGQHRDALALFAAMFSAEARPDTYSFTFVLKSCAKSGAVRFGAGVHGVTTRLGFRDSMFVGTGLVDVYSAAGMVEDARRAFDDMPERNALAWTSMVAAYVEKGDVREAQRVFDQAPEEDCDVVMQNTLLVGYLKVGDVVTMKKIFDQMPIKDIIAWNTMLSGYAKAGSDIRTCQTFFDQMPEHNVFSWNGLIDVYLRHDRFVEALGTFGWMLDCCPVVEPNEATLVTIVSAITRLGALEQGRWVDVYGCKKGFGRSLNFRNSLIDMYAKCGSIDGALKVFNSIAEKDVISWNAMIGGLAFHGLGPEVLDFFKQMKNIGNVPDAITFISVLSACSQKGLVQEGFLHFRSMNEVYKIKPSIEHYGCMVDLLGRAGLLNEAVQFVKDMPIKPDCVIWSSLQAAAVVHRDIDLAEMAMEQLIRLQPVDASNYVALSNIYGSFGRWEEYAWLKKKMREMSSSKVPGCSSVEVNGQVSVFYCSDVNHPQTEVIYSVIETLNDSLKLNLSGIELDHYHCSEIQPKCP